MKFVVFGEPCRTGLLQEGLILDLSAAATAAGWTAERCAGLARLGDLVAQGRRGLDEVRALAEATAGCDAPGVWIAAEQTRLRAPWPGGRFLLAGSNNPHHLSEAYTNMGTPLTVEQARKQGRSLVPSGFWGQARPVMGPDEDILIPSRAQGYFDYEGEPAIILGKQGKNIRAADIKDYVWGVTLVCDWSIRVPHWPPAPNPPFMPVKNFDCSKSIGPCVVVDEIDPDDFSLQTRVNGELKQDFSSRDMIYAFGEILEFFSQDFSYFPGDVISGGTGAGTAIDQTKPNVDGSWPTEPYLKAGDTVEVRADGIGSLVSHVVA